MLSLCLYCIYRKKSYNAFKINIEHVRIYVNIKRKKKEQETEFIFQIIITSKVRGFFIS